MVCSACAFENPAGMRFCGMCGMPLPQRPITAPGAHSTLRFTRVPLDSRAVRSATSQERGAALLESRGDATSPNGGAPNPAPASADVTFNASSTTASATQAPPKELVPDVPLDEYVREFRYDPPKDPGEITMHGDAPVAVPLAEPPTKALDPLAEPPKEIVAEPPKEASTPADTPVALLSSSVAEEIKPPLGAAPVAGADDIDNRLGLEPESATEARIARPRFLEINQPAKETKAEPPKQIEPVSNSGTTISGPSFLGLNDRPTTFAEAIGVEEGDYAPRNYHWRAWFAVAVVLGIGGLAWLEWRAQVNQTNDGPVEVVRTKLQKLGQSAMSEIAGQPAPAGNDDAKPETQVQEQAHAQPPVQTSPVQTSTTGAGNAGAEPTPPGSASAGNAATTVQSGSAPPRNAASTQSGVVAGQGANPKKADTDNSGEPTAAPKKPQTNRQADANTAPDNAAKPVLGADEMARAKNASDSAAEAAWLWKATAKGNPDAPVQLANMYIQGDGVPRSCEQAMVLLKTAAEKENARARNRLASMYSTGTCVSRNRVEAYRWLSSALTANPNSQWAQQNRDLIWQQMTPDERAQAQRYR